MQILLRLIFSSVRKFINHFIQCAVIYIRYIKVEAYTEIFMVKIMIVFLISVHESSAI